MDSPVLSFVRKVLSKKHIQSFFLDSSQSNPLSFDLGLREYLFEDPCYPEIMNQILSHYCQKDVYFLTDIYYCNYILIHFPDSSSMLIGPYTCTSFDESLFYKLSKELQFPANQSDTLKNYYFSLPLVKQEDDFNLLILSLVDELFGSEQTYSVDFIKTAFDEQLLYGSYTDHPDSSSQLQSIELRYTLMSQLLNAVQAANVKESTKLLTEFLSHAPSRRFSNSSKDVRNWLIIFNTQLRSAAERAHVHPYYLDQISTKFSFRIDAMTNPDHKSRIMHDMLRQYCLCVSNYAESDYSKIIQKCIILIEYDLSADLSLSSLASQLNMNASYLSTQFRKETGLTLTEYVNQKRIQQSLIYLNSTDMQVQSIGQQVGIYDMAYFTKMFKKQIGMSPTQYRRSLKADHY